MPSPIALPIARLRAMGATVHTILGHDPITTGSHPSATSRWQYGINLPDGHRAKSDGIEDTLWSYNHDWSSTFGDAVAYDFRDGRIMVTAFARPDAKAKRPAQVRASRQQIEREVATLLTRIADAAGAP